MIRRESASTIEEAASAWVVQLDRGLSPSEQAALDAWVAADPRHFGALARAQALWSQADRAQIYRSMKSAGAEGHSGFKNLPMAGTLFHGSKCIIIFQSSAWKDIRLHKYWAIL